ncbi:MAG TPA: sugar ABC transporter substrate-binding protein [Firmicutes bacterium]|nr:sugar ABC transporter substrate-binding protein [Bacillota bacterium]
MKYMKKAAILMLVVMMTMAITITSSAEKVKLVWTTCCAQTDRHALFKDIAEQYMAKNPNVEVEWMYPAGNYTDNMKTYYAAGAAPDVIWIGGDIWVFANLFLPLDELVAKDAGAKAINPAILRLSQFEGKQIGLPYGANSHTMMYNKDHFGEAGLAYPHVNWTFDDLQRMAKVLTRDTNGDGQPDRWGVHLYAVTQWGLTAGGDFYTPDGRKAQFANPVTIDMLQFAADAVSGKLGISPVPEDAQAGLKGLVSIRNLGIFDVPAYRQAPFDWDVIKFPAWVHNNQRYENTFVSLENWAIFNTTKHPKEAMDFVSFLLSREVMQQITTAGIVIPTQSIMTPSFVQSSPPANLKAFIEVLDHGHRISNTHPYGRDITTWMNSQTTWRNIWNGTVPTRIALPELQEQINIMLDEYWASVGAN